LGQDYYELLGVSQSASAAEVQRRYITLSKQYHPDKNPNDKKMAVLFQAIAKARKILTDPALRKEYDKMLMHGDHVQESDFQVPGLMFYQKFEGAPTHSPISVILLIVIMFTVMEYFFMGYKYSQTVKEAMLTPSYRAMVNARRERGPKKAKKSKSSASEPDEDLVIELVGVEPPHWSQLAVVRLAQPWVWVPAIWSSIVGGSSQKTTKPKGAMKITHTKRDLGDMVE